VNDASDLDAPRPVLSAHAWVARNPDKLELALEIADEAARADIELYTPRVPMISPKHYDPSRVDPMWRPYTDKAVRYLDARGLLEREPEQPNVVRLLDAPKAGRADRGG